MFSIVSSLPLIYMFSTVINTAVEPSVRLAANVLPPGSRYAGNILEHSLVTFIRSRFLVYRYVVWLCNKGRKGPGSMFTPCMPLWQTGILQSGVWLLRGLQKDTLQERDLLSRDGLLGALLRRDSGALAGNWGNGYPSDLDGREARC